MVFGFIRTLSNLSKLYFGSWNMYFQSDITIFLQWSEGFLVTLVHFIGEFGASPLLLHCFTMGLRNSCHKGLPKGHSTPSLNHQFVSTERRSSGPQQIHTPKVSALASMWIQLQNLDMWLPFATQERPKCRSGLYKRNEMMFFVLTSACFFVRCRKNATAHQWAARGAYKSECFHHELDYHKQHVIWSLLWQYATNKPIYSMWINIYIQYIYIQYTHYRYNKINIIQYHIIHVK